MTKNQHLFAIALLLGTAACGSGEADPKEAYSRGLAALEQGQPRTARIEFLNAIKAEPNNPKLRLLQAETYLELGDGVAAEAELRRAGQLGTPPAQTQHLLAHALLLQGKFDEAVAAAKSAAPANAAYAARIRGQAQMARGDVAGAAEGR